MVRKSVILQLALVTIIGMSMVALLIDRFSETVDLRAAMIGDGIFWKDIVYGLLSGAIIALGGIAIINAAFMRRIHIHYSNLLGRFKLSISEMVLISLCAGVGEELLFRGAVQPFLGIVITAFVFVGIHGYINPMNWRLSIYGLYMTVGISVLGFLSERHGLLTPIIAHTVIDIFLLYYLQKKAGSIFIDVNENLSDEEESNESISEHEQE